jgi:hypothetical protein
MAETGKNDLLERFLRVYSNLPLSTRGETITTYKNPENGAVEPVSWQVVFFEVINDSEKSKVFLEMLSQIGLI